MVHISAFLEDCSKVIKCMETLYGFSTQCRFEFSAAGLSIQCVPPSGLSCCDVAIAETLFTEFTFDATTPVTTTAALNNTSSSSSTTPLTTTTATINTIATTTPTTVSFRVSVAKFQELLHEKNDKNYKNTCLHFCCVHAGELRINIIVHQPEPKGGAAASSTAAPAPLIGGGSSNRRTTSSYSSPYERMLTTMLDGGKNSAARKDDQEGIDNNTDDDDDEDRDDDNESLLRATERFSNKKRRLVNNNPAAPSASVQAAASASIRRRAVISQTESVLRCEGSSMHLNPYYNLPRVVTNFDFRVWIDAVELSTIFREVSIVGNVLTITADADSSEVRFHSSGEQGDIFIRAVCVPQFHTRKDVELTMRRNGRSSLVAGSAPTFKVSESFSNRCIKFFCRIMSTPHMVCLYVTNGRPMVLSLSMHHPSSSSSSSNVVSSVSNNHRKQQDNGGSAKKGSRTSSTARHRAAASAPQPPLLLENEARPTAPILAENQRKQPDLSTATCSSLKTPHHHQSEESLTSLVAATTADVHISCHIVPHTQSRR